MKQFAAALAVLACHVSNVAYDWLFRISG